MIAMELVKFDPQVLQNPEITGVEYQQGELQGYEVREYLLQKWGRKCVYCSRENIPLEIEHIIPRSHGGSNRVSNLTLACRQCNQAKGNQELKDFLSEKSSLLEYIQAQSKKSLKDAAVVNSSRWSLFNELKNTGVLVTTGTGGQTKYNRTKLSLPKKHWIDAGCVGDVNELILLTQQPLLIEAKGHGSRQMCRTDKYGFPVAHKERRANLFGWKTGDLARAVIPKGKYTGYYPIGRVVAKKGSFLFAPPGVKGKDRISVNHKYLMPIHRRDGYAYSYS
jgi:hypothetical protein